MKYTLLLAVLSCFSTLLKAQIQKLVDYQIISTYNIDLAKDELNLQNHFSPPGNENKILAINSRLQDNELITNFQLSPPGGEGYYVVRLEAVLNGEKIEPTAGYLLGDLGKVENISRADKQIIWTNILADLPEAEGELQLVLKAAWWGILFLPYGVDCNEMPVFGFREKIPYYAGLVAGGGSFLASVLLKRKAEMHLDQHRASNILLEKGSEYDAYTRNLQRAEVATYIGFSIIALDALFYLLRREKHEKRVRVFEEFCNQNSLSVYPVSDWSGGTTASLGLQISYQF